MKIILNLSLLDDLKTDIAKVKRVIAQQFNSLLKSAGKKIESRVKKELRAAIENSETYSSLVSSQLRHEFGLTNAAGKVQTIVDMWINSISVVTKRVSFRANRISTALSLQAIKTDYSDVLSLSEAKQITEKNQELEWLKWLLLMGDTTIIKEYIVTEQAGRRGRSGGHFLMREKKHGRWWVPREFAGTINKNWITEIMDDLKLDEIVVSELNKAFV